MRATTGRSFPQYQCAPKVMPSHGQEYLMISFPAHACNFELFPEQGDAFRCLSPLLSRLSRIEFNCHVANPAANRGQLTSDFDDAFEKTLGQLGAPVFQLSLPANIPQRHDVG